MTFRPWTIEHTARWYALLLGAEITHREVDGWGEITIRAPADRPFAFATLAIVVGTWEGAAANLRAEWSRAAFEVARAFAEGQKLRDWQASERGGPMSRTVTFLGQRDERAQTLRVHEVGRGAYWLHASKLAPLDSFDRIRAA